MFAIECIRALHQVQAEMYARASVDARLSATRRLVKLLQRISDRLFRSGFGRSIVGRSLPLLTTVSLVFVSHQRRMSIRKLREFPKTAFSFMAKDAEAYLERNLAAVEDRLLSRCSDWRLYYIENDSQDRTRFILNQFSRKHRERVIGEHLVISESSSTRLCARAEPNCKARVELLGKFRSRLLQKALEWSEAVLYVVLDLDFAAFDEREFWNMYQNVLLKYAADGVFGLSTFASDVDRNFCLTQPYGCAIYDYGAILPPYVMELVMNTNETIIPVRSAFSGFGLYSVQSIRKHNATYFRSRVGEELLSMGDDPEQRQRWGLMEHIHLNLYLPKLFLYTPFRPEYNVG